MKAVIVTFLEIGLYGIEYGELSNESIEFIDHEYDRVDQNGWCDETTLIVAMNDATDAELLERVKLIDEREFHEPCSDYEEQERKWSISYYSIED